MGGRRSPAARPDVASACLSAAHLRDLDFRHEHKLQEAEATSQLTARKYHFGQATTAKAEENGFCLLHVLVS